MDDQKDSKTLEEGSVESKFVQSQNPCGQNPEEDSVLSKFSKTCNGSVLGTDENGSGNNGQIDVNSITFEMSNVEESRLAKSGENGLEGFENNQESFKGEGVGKENEMKRASLGSDIEREFLVKSNKGANNGDGSQIEVALAVIENEGTGLGMNAAKEAVEKTDDATKVHRSDSPRKIDGISLFVEVFGSLDGIYQVEDGKFSNENVLREGDSSENMSCERNGTLSPHNCGDASAGVSQTPDFILDMINTGTTEEANELDDVVDECVGNQECNFVVGDLVWIKTKTNLWWPGVVSDPSNATKDAGSNKKGSLLVKYFGNANFVWCFPSHLKHFLQCFDEMVQQNNSRSFYGAVERAVSEIGRRVKEEMTCSCFSKGSGAEASVQTVNGNSVSKQKIGDLCAFSVSQFQPANFLAHIKCLAQDGSVPGKINLTVTQNCLSAFYHSLGHCQLPMHQLRPTDAKDSTQRGSTVEKEYGNLTEVSRDNSNSLEKCGGEVHRRQPISRTLTSKLMEEKENCSGEVEIFAGRNITSSEIAHSSPIKSPGATDGSLVSGQIGNGRINRRSDKGNLSRERKKSKYLSYPYIDPSKDTPTSGQNEIEDPEKVSNPGTECNSKNSLKRGPRKSNCGLNAVCKPEDINSSSAEMLSELHLTALNCSYYKERRCSASIKRFFSCFRRFAFLNNEIASNKDDDDDSLQFNHKDNFAQKLPEAQSQIEGTNKSSEDAGEHPSSSGKPKKRRRKKEAATSASTVFPCTMVHAVNGSLVNECQRLGTDATQGKKVSRKREKTGAVSGISDIEPTAQLSDVNANSTNSLVEGLRFTGNSASQGRRVRKKRKLKESPTRNGVGLLDLHGKCVKFVQLLKDVQKVGPNVQLLKDVQAAGPSLLASIPEQNSIMAETELTSEIMVRQPEASVNHVESGSLVQNLQQTQILNPGANPEQKKRRRRKKTLNLVNTEVNYCIPDLNGNVGESGSGGNNATDMNSVSNNNKPRRRRRRNKPAAAVPDKVQNSVELSGAILLNFTSGVPLPSVESLLTTFAGYGALKESETRCLDDSTAQVVFVQSSDALRAFRSLQESNPFGTALAGSRLVYLSAPRNSPIPDLNGNIAESGSAGNNVTDINSVPNKDKPQRRRRRNKVQNNEELSGAILLNFTSGVALPSVESLVTTFVGYGALKESETRFLNDSSAQVVFVQTSDALQAFRSLQESNPFGPALAGCRFIYLSAPPAPKPTNNLQMPQTCLPRNGSKTPAMPSGLNPNSGDPPDLLTIKQNLEMMKSMLEKAGNNLSAEMRAKLESEIKGLMQKVNSTVGSSSS